MDARKDVIPRRGALVNALCMPGHKLCQIVVRVGREDDIAVVTGKFEGHRSLPSFCAETHQMATRRQDDVDVPESSYSETLSQLIVGDDAVR